MQYHRCRGLRLRLPECVMEQSKLWTNLDIAVLALVMRFSMFFAKTLTFFFLLLALLASSLSCS